MMGIKMFSQFMESRKAMTDTCVIHGLYAEISYTYEGRPYKIFVPFNRRKVPKCLGMSVSLMTPEKAMDITHQPGIPYFCSASNFGSDSKITVTDQDGDSIDITGNTIINI